MMSFELPFFTSKQIFLREFLFVGKKLEKDFFEGNNFLKNIFLRERYFILLFCFENQIRSNFEARILDGKIAQSQYCFVDYKKNVLLFGLQKCKKFVKNTDLQIKCKHCHL